MIFVSWFVCWIILSCIGIIGVYRAGRSIERWLPNMSLFYFVLVSTGVLVTSYVTAVRLVGVEQAGCEELDPSADNYSVRHHLSSANGVSQLKMILNRSICGSYNLPRASLMRSARHDMA